jgi:hypothetical protein
MRFMKHARFVLASAVLAASASPAMAQSLPAGWTTTPGAGVSPFGSSFFTCAPGYTDCIYNDWGYALSTVNSATPFTFGGGLFDTQNFFSSSFATSLTFIGSDGTNTYTSSACAISNTSWNFCGFSNGTTDFSNVLLTQLSFQTAGGIDAFGSDPGGYFVGDGLLVNQSTAPEPASIALLATGLVGVIGVARRRRSGSAS